MKKKYLAILLSLTLSIGIPFSSVYSDIVAEDDFGNKYEFNKGPKNTAVSSKKTILIDEEVNDTKMISSSDDISVVLNGEPIQFDVPPQLIENRTMVPLRKIFEAMGATVEWDNETQTVTATKGNDRVIATVNNKNVYINGETKVLDVPPMIVNERTLVPTRFVAEAFGANVKWEESSKTVMILTKWNASNPMPFYKENPSVLDLGAISGVFASYSDKNFYSYDINQFDKYDRIFYISAMEDLGFEHIEYQESDVFKKNNLTVELYANDNEISVRITK